MMRPSATWAVSVLVALASAGWVVPAVMAFNALATGVEIGLAGQVNLHSFPHLHFARQACLVAGVWLFFVLVAWSVAAVRRILPTDPRRDRNDVR